MMSRSPKGESSAEAVLKLGDLLEQFDERLGALPEPEILTLTEKLGFVLQRERFKKRLAISDTSNYKLIGLGDIAFNPYLLWANAIAQNTGWEKAIISPLYPTFRVRKGYSARFVNYLLCSGYLRSHYGGISYGSVPRKRRATVSDFLNLPIPRQPSLAEQERIVEILDEADAIRKLRAESDRHTAALIPALFHAMFGDPSTNSKNWPLRPAGELMEACDYGTSQKANEEGRGISVLRMGNVTANGRLDLEDLKTVALADNELTKQRLQAGDVLFNRTNSRELVGKTAMWDGRFEAVAASYFIRVRFRADVEHPQHFTTFMNLPFMKRRLAEIARGAVGQANINSKELKSIPVPVPPLPLQNEFAHRVIEIRDVETDQATSRSRLDALFQSMLHRAFNGELRQLNHSLP
jgi:type I restriction enzyme S subunit